MARRSRAEALEDDTPELDISSLIDVCFLLLIYFLVTTTIKKKEQDLPLTLPGNQSASVAKIDTLFIIVEDDGSVSTKSGSDVTPMDDPSDSHELPNLEQHIQIYVGAAVTSGSEPVVQIQVESETETQRAVDVLNLLRKHKVKGITFTDTEPPK